MSEPLHRTSEIFVGSPALRSRGNVRILLVLALFAAKVSLAQPVMRSDDLYVNPSFSGSASRVVGLAGAYVAVAEGLDGMPMNVASIAQRSPTARSSFSLEPLATLSIPNSTDLDNDGVADDNAVALLGALGLRIQIFKVGLGVFWRGEAASRCANADCSESLAFAQTDLSVGSAITLWRDQLLFGAAWYRPHSTVTISNETTGAVRTRANANGSGAQLSALYRPQQLPFRIGASFRSAVNAPFELELGGAADYQARPVYRGIATPAVLSTGVVWNFFHGAENLNRLSPAALREYDELSDDAFEKLTPFPEDNTGRLMLAAQLDVALPVSRAVGIRGYVTNGPTLAAGANPTFTPRLGIEHLTIINRLRLRAGSYLEPSVFQGVGPRAHGAGGFDLRLFELLVNWTLSGYFDVANGYQVYGVTIGGW